MAVDAPPLEDAANGEEFRRDGSLVISRAQVAAFLGLANELSPDELSPEGPGGGATFTHASSLDGADALSIVFTTDAGALERALASDAGLILAPLDSAVSPRVLRTKDPRLAFAQVYARWFTPQVATLVHPAAQVDPTARIGAGCQLGAGAVVGAGVQLGAGCQLGPCVVVLAGTTLGDRVRVQAGAVLGSDGFGYVRGPSGYLPFPQLGTLVIEDDVDIGANTTIDRGALGETRIGRGTKIDNLVHIAHNCRIGADVVIAAQTGIAGSTLIGDGAVLGGQVGIGDHVDIGPGVILGSQSGVLPQKRMRGPGQLFWGTPARPLRQFLRDLARLSQGKR